MVASRGLVVLALIALGTVGAPAELRANRDGDPEDRGRLTLHVRPGRFPQSSPGVIPRSSDPRRDWFREHVLLPRHAQLLACFEQERARGWQPSRGVQVALRVEIPASGPLDVGVLLAPTGAAATTACVVRTLSLDGRDNPSARPSAPARPPGRVPLTVVVQLSYSPPRSRH